MELSSEQHAGYKNCPFVDLSGEIPFPEDLLPKHSKVGSKVPFMTLVAGLCEFLSSGGDFSVLRRLWGHFCVTLGDQSPEFSVTVLRPLSESYEFLFFHSFLE